MLDLLKSELEEAAFMLVDDACRKDIHSKLVNCLVILEQARNEETVMPESQNHADRDEINKVSRRLKMWAKPDRQEQYNAKILNTYLKLSREGQNKITEEDIHSAIGNATWFWANFNQMKAISDRNHGKVFDVTGHYVNIWAPILSSVKEYEKQVFEEG